MIKTSIVKIIEELNTLLQIRCDRAYHALYGLILYNVLGLYDNTIAVITVIAIGVLKEVYDFMNANKHTADVWDAVATMLVPICLYSLSMI